MLLKPEFMRGATEFIDKDVHGNDRIIISVKFSNQEPTRMIVDTGAPYSILAPDVAERIGFDRSTEYPLGRPINIRGHSINGWLYRVPVILEAQEGENLEFEATVFIPDISDDIEWPPELNFIGLQGFLFRIRFAIDPDDNLFYFGGPI
jgi:hypothetical protein